jgi:outer membrane protein OmpA-like peptidoglycan-associated protein/tetratricopeptide (TPR) repeat protein
LAFATAPASAQQFKIPKAAPESYGIQSKRARDAYELALEMLRRRMYKDALPQLNIALKEEPGFDAALYKKAETLLLLKQIDQGKPLLEQLARKHPAGEWSIMPHLFYYLGQCYMQGGDYRAAIDAFQRYLNGKGQLAAYKKIAEDEMARADFALQAKQHAIVYKPINLGPAINSPGDDYVPSVTADDRLIFFTSRREGNTGGFDQVDRAFDEDFYFSTRDSAGNWRPAINLGPPINTELNEGTACISPDAQYVYFTACYRPESIGGCDLYVSRLEGYNWSRPKNLGTVVNSRYYDTQPNLSPDGRMLYFVSNRPGGLGGTDIWQSHWQDGRWQAPTNLGPPINTAGDEYGPYLHSDDRTLYFSSDGHKGFGGLDLFMSVRDSAGWSLPRNLGYPLNTAADEQYLVLNAAGTKGYTNSNAPGGIGKLDIYEFKVDSNIRPGRATYVRGLVQDSLTGKPVGATVVVVQLDRGDTTRNVQSNSATGRFLLSLPAGRDYAAFVDAPGYLFYSRHFSLRNINDEKFFDLVIKLQSLKTGATVVLNNIFFETDKAELLPASQVELRKLLLFLKQNPQARIEVRGHTDNVGTAAYNLDLSRRRAEAVRRYLVKNGIVITRIAAQGYGETLPVAPNDTDAGRAQNRRTEFTLLQLK